MGLKKEGKAWDSSTMTLTADKKGRICSRDLFKPSTSFDAKKQEDGSVLLRELAPVQTACEVLDMADLNPITLLPKGDWQIKTSSIAEAIRADREGRA